MDSDKKKFLRRYAICVGLLAASCVVFPLLVLGAHGVGASGVPRFLSNLLFLWPQYLLWPNGIAERETEAVRGAAALPWSSILFWLAALGVYAVCLRRVRMLWVIVALFPAVLVVAEIALWVLGGLGFRVVIDAL